MSGHFILLRHNAAENVVENLFQQTKSTSDQKPWPKKFLQAKFPAK